ncbi:MFS transporter [Streptomyces roseolilacinus]|uniref:MFS transporter n=1 Tax=Streptomyces roseolilacinus TaxID=66904 RepID=UPI003817F3EC
MRDRHALAWYATGAALARTGDEAAGPALLLAGLAATGSSATASALLAASTAAAAIGGPVLGALLDRSARPGRLLAGALAGHAASLLAVLVCLGRTPAAVPLLVAAASGLLAPALSGGWTAQLPRVAGPGSLPRATALDAMTFHAAALAGPALTAAAATLYGAGAAVLTAAALLAAALPAVRALPRGSATPPRSGHLAAELVAGFRALARTPALARVTGASVLSCAGQGALVACTPLLGERHLGGAGYGALLLAVLAAAALAANAVLARLRRPPAPHALFRAATLLQGAALLPAAAAGHPAPLVAAVALAGLGEGPQLTALFAIRHREAPPRLRGQVFTTGASLKISGFALGAAAAGPLAGVSPPGTLLAAAAVQLLAAALTVPAGRCRTARRTAPRRPRARGGRTPGTPGPAGTPARHRPAPPRAPGRSSYRDADGAP